MSQGETRGDQCPKCKLTAEWMRVHAVGIETELGCDHPWHKQFSTQAILLSLAEECESRAEKWRVNPITAAPTNNPIRRGHAKAYREAASLIRSRIEGEGTG